MMETEQNKELMEQFARTGLRSLRLSQGDFTLEMEAGGACQPAAAATAAPAVQPAPAPAAPAEEEQGVAVTAPVVGVYYEGPAPGADPFIKVGQQVEKGQTLCILEAMKMMNEIEAPVSGQVVAIEAVPGELVSFGQTLVRILPR